MCLVAHCLSVMCVSSYCCSYPPYSNCSVTQSCLTLCDSMNCSTPSFPVLHHLPEFAQTHWCLLNRWCCSTVSSSATTFSFSLQSFPASESFPMSRLFASGDQSIGASASVLPMYIQGWFPLGLTGSIFLLRVQGTLKSLLQYHISKASILWHLTFFMVQLLHLYMTIGKTITLIMWPLLAK